MGFSFRKSIRLGGGLRLNISKRGIGFSGGVKGARFGVGPRGARVSVGKGAMRYQTTIGGGKQKSRRRRSKTAASEPGLVASATAGALKLVAAIFLLAVIATACGKMMLLGIAS